MCVWGFLGGSNPSLSMLNFPAPVHSWKHITPFFIWRNHAKKGYGAPKLTTDALRCPSTIMLTLYI